MPAGGFPGQRHRLPVILRAICPPLFGATSEDGEGVRQPCQPEWRPKCIANGVAVRTVAPATSAEDRAASLLQEVDNDEWSRASTFSVRYLGKAGHVAISGSRH